MHIVNSCADDIHYIDNNSVIIENYHLSRFLSTSALSSLSSLIIYADCLPADFTLNVLLFSSLWKAVFKYSL